MSLIVNTANALEAAITNGSAVTLASALTSTKAPGLAKYVYCANCDSWIQQGNAPTASAGAGSMFVPANMQLVLDGAYGVALSVIADSSSGRASLAPVVSVV
jgi:hypothetical protein